MSQDTASGLAHTLLQECIDRSAPEKTTWRWLFVHQPTGQKCLVLVATCDEMTEDLLAIFDDAIDGGQMTVIGQREGLV